MWTQTSGKSQAGKDCSAAKAFPSALASCPDKEPWHGLHLGQLLFPHAFGETPGPLPSHARAHPPPSSQRNPRVFLSTALNQVGIASPLSDAQGEKKKRTKEERGKLPRRHCSASTNAQNAEWESQLAERLMPALHHPELHLPRAQDHAGPLLLDRRAQTGLFQTWLRPKLWHAKKRLWIGERKSKASLASPSAGSEGSPIRCFQQHLGDSSCKLCKQATRVGRRQGAAEP